MNSPQRGEALRLNSMDLCMRYGISYQSLDNWKLREGFPRDAAIRTKKGLMWDHERVDAWLRSRRIVKGHRPRWLEVVGHSKA